MPAFFAGNFIHYSLLTTRSLPRRLAEQHLLRFLVVGEVAAIFLSDRPAPFHRRPRRQRLEPALEVGEVVEILPLVPVGPDPADAGHVGDGVVAGEIVAVGEAL